MSDYSCPTSQRMPDCVILDEETSITGGKSVSEIVQLLRTKAKLKITKDFDKDEETGNQPYSENKLFPWVAEFTLSCREVIEDPNIKKLDELITNFLVHAEEDVKQCYKKPKRAYRLRLQMHSFLVLFHMIYSDIKKPLEHTSYLEKMSEVMALYIDVEMKSSVRGREHPKKIAERICSSLFLFLDKSIDHILDSVLKSKYFIKKYSDICLPVMARLLKDHPGQLYEITYIRHLLSFKLWKKLAGKDQYININKEAVAKLKPPPDFADKLRSGIFTNVLPYVSKTEKGRLTQFFMRSPFNVKKKAQLFLKEKGKIQTTADLNGDSFFDADLTTVMMHESRPDESDNCLDILTEVWNSLLDKESDSLDDIFDIDGLDEEESILVDLRKTNCRLKANKVPNEIKTNGALKTSVKKRKLVKGSSCVSAKNNLNKEHSEQSRKLVPKPIVTPVTVNEENSFITSLNVDETLKKDERSNLSLSNSPEPLKLQKPCAAVEPEQCKEVEPDSQSKSTELLPVKLSANPILNSVEVDGQELKINSTVEQLGKVVESCEKPASSSFEVIVINATATENPSAAALSEIVDSSGICEEIKMETNTNDIFVVKEDEHRLIDDHQMVAQEVIIGTEPSHDDTCTTFLAMEGVGQDTATFCSDSASVAVADIWKKHREKPTTHSEIGSLLENHCNTVTVAGQQSTGNVKEPSSCSPENQQFLSSIVASSESNDNYVSLDRREDSYSYNDIMLSKLFSEVNEESDDDNRYHSQGQYARGGKIPAFREQLIEESKSDGGEEFESPSSEITISQPVSVDLNSREYDQEMKSHPLTPIKGENLTQPSTVAQGKSFVNDSPQLREVSVSLSYMNGLSPCDYQVGNDKINPKGMCEPPDNILHFQTVDDDCKFYSLQEQLCTLYNTTQNILDTDPVPYPPTVVVSPPINGFVRCPCVYCNNNFFKLDKNHKILVSMRSNRVCLEVDKNRLLSKMYHQIEQTRLENDKLLKSIEESIPKSKDSIKEKEFVVQKSEDKAIGIVQETVSQTETCTPDLKKITKTEEIALKKSPPTLSSINSFSVTGISDRSENPNEAKNEYSSLPPKKRKAFSLHSDLVSNQQLVHCIQPEVDIAQTIKKSKIGSENESNIVCSENIAETILGSSSSTTNSEERITSIATTSCSVVIDKYLPVNIKRKQGQYCVYDENSLNVQNLDGEQSTSENIPQNHKKSKHEKCHKRHKKSKEERKLKREQRKLRKQIRKENSM